MQIFNDLQRTVIVNFRFSEVTQQYKSVIKRPAPAENAESAAGDEKIIAIVPWDMAESFAVDFSHAAEEEIAAKGWKSVVMDPKGDWTQEYTIIENLVTQRVDGIIYTAIDADGANDLLPAVQEAGIPIVGYDCLGIPQRICLSGSIWFNSV